MDVVNLIKKTKSEIGLKLLAKASIAKARKLSKENNEPNDYIGTGAGINPDYSFDPSSFLMYDCIHGYIPKGTKIVYGTFYNLLDKTYSNRGFYYYMDDESYILDFFKYLQTQDIEDDYDVFIALKIFLDQYFSKLFSSTDREKLHHLFYKPDGYFYEPSKEHSIKDFKGNGSAQCSEYTALAENILSALGYDVMYVMSSSHAYNILMREEDGKFEAAVIDFASGVKAFDHNFKGNMMYPYIEEIPDADLDYINDFIANGGSFSLQDYFLEDVNGSFYKMYTNQYRTYATMHDNAQKEDFDLVRHK